jgi:hypothetical protein
MEQPRPPLLPWQYGQIDASGHDVEHHRFIHLIRLAWDLREREASVNIDMTFGKEMFLHLPGLSAADPVQVRAAEVGGHWWFSWRRRRGVWAYEPDAPGIILRGVGRGAGR